MPFQKSEKNINWKGDKVKYRGLHEWVERRLPKPDFCERCNLVKPHDLANKSGNYLRDLSDWEWLCRKCHITEDGRLEELHKKLVRDSKTGRFISIK